MSLPRSLRTAVPEAVPRGPDPGRSARCRKEDLPFCVRRAEEAAPAPCRSLSYRDVLRASPARGHPGVLSPRPFSSRHLVWTADRPAPQGGFPGPASAGPARPTRAARTPSSESGLPARPAQPAGGFPAARTPRRRGEGAAPAPTPAPRAARAGDKARRSVPGAGESPMRPSASRALPPRAAQRRSRARERGPDAAKEARAAPPGTGRPRSRPRRGAGRVGTHRDCTAGSAARRTPRCSRAAPGRCGARFRELHGSTRCHLPGPAPRHPAGRQGAGRGRGQSAAGRVRAGPGGGAESARLPAPPRGRDLAPGRVADRRPQLGTPPPRPWSPGPLVRAQGLRPGRLQPLWRLECDCQARAGK